MTKLTAITHKIRSKNAGPFWITIDIFCSDDAEYRRALGAVKNEQVAHALGILDQFETIQFNKFARDKVQLSPPDCPRYAVRP